MSDRADVEQLAAELAAIPARLDEVQQRVEALLQRERERVAERAALAALPRARLLSTSIELDGRPSDRMRVRRVSVGAPFAQPFTPALGVTWCVTDAADVRDWWERLLANEAASGEDVLRGQPATVLDVPGATVAAVGGRLRVSLTRTHATTVPVLAVPRCAYDFPRQKLSNFGHWLLDCVPQYVALAAIAPGATFLLPEGVKGFHRRTLGLVGLSAEQLLAWDGSPLDADRVLALEGDGRAGGGRPFSLLVEMRRVLGSDAPETTPRRGRRLYISRRDAPPRRQWISNELDVEALFRSRGFEVIVMAECPLEEQVRLFRDADIVAGGTGAGLSDLVFSRRGTHVLVLISDSQIRWYADADGARSGWLSGRRDARKPLASFGDSPRFWVHVAAGFDQPCHSFVAGDRMPIDQLAVFVDDVLKRVDGA